MESVDGFGLANEGHSVRKTRSVLARRPHSSSQTLLQKFTFLPPPTHSSASTSNSSFTSQGSENKLKLKLKLGGITHTIQARASSDYAKSFHHHEDKYRGSDCDKLKGLEMRSKDKTKPFSSSGKEIEPARKSKRVPKRRVLDVGLDDDEEDEEIRYLGKLGASKFSADFGDEENNNGTERQGQSRLGKHGRKKLKLEDIYEDKDYMEGNEPVSEDELGFKKKNDLFVEGINESIPTTRNRALHSGKDTSSGSAGFIEFPDGLPFAPSKKQKEKLSEVDQQLKKSEAAQRRRMQSEKAAREAEAEAIRKILGQDSARKKKEDKMKKRRDELAQVKAASKFEILAPNTIRYVIGPTGTVLSFSEDIGLPSIFSRMTCCYPQPREKCAGPNCSNPYKYRDSKSKLPLCSLQCYKAVNGKSQSLLAC
ncbi:hypothetical protein ACFE04_015671 [Oxalis oulophora]